MSEVGEIASELFKRSIISSEVFRSLSEHEFATFHFDGKTCGTAMRIYS